MIQIQNHYHPNKWKNYMKLIANYVLFTLKYKRKVITLIVKENFDQLATLIIKNIIDETYKFTNQKEYDELCDEVILYVQQYLVKKLNMIEEWIPLPEHNDKKKGANNIFVSSKCCNIILEDFTKNKNGCLILIQGTGAVYAGYDNFIVVYGRDIVA